MNKIRQMPLLLILVTASMLCAGFLNIARGQSLFVSRSPEETIQPDTAAESDAAVDSSAESPDSLDNTVPASEAEPGTQPAFESDLESDLESEFEPDFKPELESEFKPELESEAYEFTEVTRDYLDDALFIGDSRAEGVKLYSGWDNLTYYAEGGLTVYNIFKRQVVEDGNQKITIEEALQNHSFGKIYLEIGINEMGTGTVDSFMKQYEDVVSHLRELQPDAIIFLCGIMMVTEARSETDPIFNNPNIRERNERIAALADQKDIFYLDFNEMVTDENGNLNTDYTWDAVHLLGKYDSLWLDYFLQHGIVK